MWMAVSVLILTLCRIIEIEFSDPGRAPDAGQGETYNRGNDLHRSRGGT
jgi:hypothetical protein